MSVGTPRNSNLSSKYRTYIDMATRVGQQTLDLDVAFRRDFDAWFLVNNFDLHCRSVIDASRKTIIGDRFEIEPYSSGYADRKFSEGAEDIIRRIPQFHQSLFASTELPFLGRSYTYVNVRQEVLDLFSNGNKRVWNIPYELKHIHPFRFRKFNNPDRTIRKEIYSLTEGKWIDLSEDDKLVLIDLVNSVEEQTFTNGSPLINPIYAAYVLKKDLEVEILSAGERFGQGFLILYLEEFNSSGSKGKNNEIQKQKKIEILRSAKAHHGIVLGSKDKAEIIHPSSAGAEILKGLIDKIDSDLTINVLGANLTIEGGSSGSYNQSENHKETIYQRASYNRNIIMGGYTQVLLHNIIYGMNVQNWIDEGLGDCRPGKIIIPSDKENKPSETIEVMDKAVNDLGLTLDESSAMESLNLPQATPEDRKIKRTVENIPAPFDITKKIPLESSKNLDEPAKRVYGEKASPESFDKSTIEALQNFVKYPTRENKALALVQIILSGG